MIKYSRVQVRVLEAGKSSVYASGDSEGGSDPQAKPMRCRGEWLDGYRVLTEDDKTPSRIDNDSAVVTLAELSELTGKARTVLDPLVKRLGAPITRTRAGLQTTAAWVRAHAAEIWQRRATRSNRNDGRAAQQGEASPDAITESNGSRDAA